MVSWYGTASAARVVSSATSRVDFSGCEIDYMDSKELPEEEQRRASMMLNLLEAIRTDGDTLCMLKTACAQFHLHRSRRVSAHG